MKWVSWVVEVTRAKVTLIFKQEKSMSHPYLFLSLIYFSLSLLSSDVLASPPHEEEQAPGKQTFTVLDESMLSGLFQMSEAEREFASRAHAFLSGAVLREELDPVQKLRCQAALAQQLFTGLGCTKDLAESRRLFSIVVSSDLLPDHLVYTHVTYGLMLMDGKGGESDYVSAEEQFKIAIDSPHVGDVIKTEAKCCIAKMIFAGQLEDRELREAYDLLVEVVDETAFAKAHEMLHSEAKIMKDNLESQLD